jgi:Zn-dependent peptidase ImmA (M78 family)
MPEEKFKKVWKVWYDNFNFKKYRVAQFFGVSVEAVHYRAKELELF